MIEFNDIVLSINRLRDKITELSAKIDYLSKTPTFQLSQKYVDDAAACKILHMSPRTLAKMRTSGTIPFIKFRRRILYLASDLHFYLENHSKK